MSFPTRRKILKSLLFGGTAIALAACFYRTIEDPDGVSPRFIVLFGVFLGPCLADLQAADQDAAAGPASNAALPHLGDQALELSLIHI